MVKRTPIHVFLQWIGLCVYSDDHLWPFRSTIYYLYSFSMFHSYPMNQLAYVLHVHREKPSPQVLTHLSRTFISRPSPFQILGRVLGGSFLCFSPKFDSIFCKQTVKPLIRHRIFSMFPSYPMNQWLMFHIVRNHPYPLKNHKKI